MWCYIPVERWKRWGTAGKLQLSCPSTLCIWRVLCNWSLTITTRRERIIKCKRPKGCWDLRRESWLLKKIGPSNDEMRESHFPGLWLIRLGSYLWVIPRTLDPIEKYSATIWRDIFGGRICLAKCLYQDWLLPLLLASYRRLLQWGSWIMANVPYWSQVQLVVNPGPPTINLKRIQGLFCTRPLYNGRIPSVLHKISTLSTLDQLGCRG